MKKLLFLLLIGCTTPPIRSTAPDPMVTPCVGMALTNPGANSKGGWIYEKGPCGDNQWRSNNPEDSLITSGLPAKAPSSFVFDIVNATAEKPINFRTRISPHTYFGTASGLDKYKWESHMATSRQRFVVSGSIDENSGSGIDLEIQAPVGTVVGGWIGEITPSH